jgi:hypothetical protein
MQFTLSCLSWEVHFLLQCVGSLGPRFNSFRKYLVIKFYFFLHGVAIFLHLITIGYQVLYLLLQMATIFLIHIDMVTNFLLKISFGCLCAWHSNVFKTFEVTSFLYSKLELISWFFPSRICLAMGFLERNEWLLIFHKWPPIKVATNATSKKPKKGDKWLYLLFRTNLIGIGPFIPHT